jgi:metal-responsive CopG/Arc/MetJ family transcriptional regulator
MRYGERVMPKKAEAKVPVSFMCDPKVLQELDAIRKVEEGLLLPRSALIEKALRDWLERRSKEQAV